MERIPISQIRARPWFGTVDTADPRQEALNASVRSRGILEPLLLRPAPHGFTVVLGTRRLHAASVAALAMVPAVVKRVADDALLMLAVWSALERLALEPWAQRIVVDRLLAAGIAPSDITPLVSTLDWSSTTADSLGGELLIDGPALRPSGTMVR